jgi:hypothetical protein
MAAGISAWLAIHTTPQNAPKVIDVHCIRTSQIKYRVADRVSGLPGSGSGSWRMIATVTADPVTSQ